VTDDTVSSILTDDTLIGLLAMVAVLWIALLAGILVERRRPPS
jgi:hypothetical protein